MISKRVDIVHWTMGTAIGQYWVNLARYSLPKPPLMTEMRWKRWHSKIENDEKKGNSKEISSNSRHLTSVLTNMRWYNVIAITFAGNLCLASVKKREARRSRRAAAFILGQALALH